MIKNLYRWIKADSKRELTFLLLLVIIIRTFGFGLYQVPSGSMETTMLVGERFFADKFTPLFRGPKRGNIISFNDPTFIYSKNPIVRLFQEYFWGPSNWTKRVIGVPGDTIKGVIENGKPIIYVNGQELKEPYINKYPLLDILNDDVYKVIEQSKKEAIKYMTSHRIDPQEFNNIVEQTIKKYRMLVSYDPSVRFERQEFYSIRENQVIPDENGKMSMIMPGVPLQTPGFKTERSGNSYWNGSDEFYIELDDHHYWVMGDNRLGSNDCRYWGPLDGSYIHGKILLRLWSVDSREWLWLFDLIKHPIDFWSRVRWKRFIQVLH